MTHTALTEKRLLYRLTKSIGQYNDDSLGEMGGLPQVGPECTAILSAIEDIFDRLIVINRETLRTIQSAQVRFARPVGVTYRLFVGPQFVWKRGRD